MITSSFEDFPANHIAPVFDFYTHSILSQVEISSLVLNTQLAYVAGDVKLVFVSEAYPENVISLEDFRLQRELNLLTSHLPKSSVQCPTNVRTNPSKGITFSLDL